MAYQILFSDLDGTLLNDEKFLTEANVSAAKKAQAAGKQIIINSGRSWHSLTSFEERLGLNRPGCYGSGFNGGVVYEYTSSSRESRKVLSQNVLSNEKGLAAAEKLKQLGADVVVYTLNDLYAEKQTELNEYYYKTSSISLQIKNFNEVEGGIIKILALGDNAELKRLQQAMTPYCGDDIYMVFSCPWLLEFGPPAANKGSSVKFMAELLNVPFSEIIAMGDEENDATMLQVAGLGLAVANGTGAAKQAAKKVLPCSNNESAFAYVVEKYLL